MHRLSLLWNAVSHFGPRIVLLRGRIALRQRLGLERRHFRPRPWNDIQLSQIFKVGTPQSIADYAAFKRGHPATFFFPLGKPPQLPSEFRAVKDSRSPELPQRLQLLADGRVIYFFHTSPPHAVDWYTNGLTGERSLPAASQPWYAIPDFLPQQGDPRTLWEPARAAWALDLARAESHGIQMNAAELFFRWLDSWMDACPPWQGFQWKCGQEAGVRFIALALGFWSLADKPECARDRFCQFARLAWATAERIAHHIDYAVSQKNNHALSEATALLLISHLFPEFRDSNHWQRIARRVLTSELPRQIYADGSYVQHSLNYHRVMLDDATLALRIAELARQPFPRSLYDLVGKAAAFLFELMDEKEGHVPLYGNNDGAHVLPLTECEFRDYRPAIQSAYYLTHRTRLLPPGPWDESLYWLFGDEVDSAPPTVQRHPTSQAFEQGGYYTLRGKESWAFIRCHNYRDRPGHYDPLHVDLWWRGQNVLHDSGTYQYYTPANPRLENYSRSIHAHNCVELPDIQPFTQISRFLSFPWPKARKRSYQGREFPMWFEGENLDFRAAGVVHRRLLIGAAEGIWIIVDDLIGHGSHRAWLRWHLSDDPVAFDASRRALQLDTAQGPVSLQVAATGCARTSCEIVRGIDDGSHIEGIHSFHYGHRHAHPVLKVEFAGTVPLRVLTAVGCGVSVDLAGPDADDFGQAWAIRGGEAIFRLQLALPDDAREKTAFRVTQLAPLESVPA